VVVRQTGMGSYEIVVGERRFRAAKLIQLETIPAIVRNSTIGQHVYWHSSKIFSAPTSTPLKKRAHSYVYCQQLSISLKTR
jgi:hypothetical protein